LPLSAFNITINDADGQPMNISLRTNFSGAWVTFNESNGLANGTYSFTNTSWISGLGQRVFWSVNLTDGIYWVNRSYWFTTEGLDVVPIYPEENSVVPPQPYLTFYISHPEGNSMSYEVYIGDSADNVSTLVCSSPRSGVDNGTYHCPHWDAVNITETYYWSVHLSSGFLYINETFSFNVSTGTGGMISMGNSFALVLALGGWIFGIGGILLAVFILTSKKGKRRKK
jgi:hypothetical protein